MIKGVATIGIVGGGQLGRMLTLAAKPLGFDVIVVDPSDNAPAAQVGATQIKADLYDSKALKELAKKSDFITIEIEHLDAKTLGKIAGLGKSVHPSPATIELIQDKLSQKEFFASRGVPVDPFQDIPDKVAAQAALKKFGKMVVKARFGAYDGRGNGVVSNEKELNTVLKEHSDSKLYAEKFVPFSKELAVMVARSTDGKVVLYPVVETKHVRSICVEVMAPAQISAVVEERAKTLAKKVAKNLDGAGVFGVEMFLTKDGHVLLNEVAPRVHNSGHYTIEGTTTSQFEQHVRAISGLPLGDTSLTHPAAVMINILGERNGPTKVEGLDQALKIPGVSVHIYGKSPTKFDRKMGHITAVSETMESAKKHAATARRRLSI